MPTQLGRTEEVDETTKQVTQLGFSPEKEAADTRDENWFFGTGEDLSGIADGCGSVIGALYAWPVPVKGIYPRSMNQINHAIILINEAVVKSYLPDGEIQRGREDFMDCASRAPDNDIETQLTYAIQNNLLREDTIQWLKEKGYADENGKVTLSDRYTAIRSYTTRQGNSLKAPEESIRKNGVIPKKMLPKEDWMGWADYHNPTKITQEMDNLAKEFLSHITVNYEKVNYSDFPKFLKDSKWFVFDNYLDRDGDFIKQLAPNYNMMGYGYRNVINETKKKTNMKVLKDQNSQAIMIAKMVKNEAELSIELSNYGIPYSPKKDSSGNPIPNTIEWASLEIDGTVNFK